MDLKGRTVLVTGAAKRIGKSIALAFAQKGADILLHYNHSAGEAEDTRKEILKLGVTCRLVKADLGKPSGPDEFFKNAGALLDRVSVLVNSASVFHETPLEKVSRGDWDQNLSLHLIAPFELARRIGLRIKAADESPSGPTARRAGGGVIVNITDSSILRPYRGHAPYLASKAALANLTKTLAVELSPHVRVNSVAPGAILFPDGYSEEEKAKIVAGIPMKRAGRPENVADACVFLAEADYVNGISLNVDGGRT